ncbi:hypothetical protein [Hyalangium minutum]|uniref:Uncharacterized protein n=1 Tax=Hyalangium minutum TaxID=394096 RepID=A0A085WV08_9BACT|nr:hypothetical protein [Hyalangium minutum]KFE71521.1 hypothetical protein DB31_3651 [Hyalangium minutum]
MSDEQQPAARPKFNPLRWIEPSLNGLVTVALLVLTWVLATSETGRAFRENLAWYGKLALAVLAGVLILAITHWSNIRARVEEQWLALAKTTAALAPSLVKPALLVLLAAILFTAYCILRVQPQFMKGPMLLGISMPLLGILCLSSAPALLTLGVSLLVERRMARGDFSFEVNPALISSRKYGAQVVKHARANWEYEREIMEGAIHRMGRHAGILGFLASSILITCTVLMTTEDDYIALAVGTSVTISFTLHLGQIFFRSASNDATARMMARASRTLLIVSVCALFFGALLLEGNPLSAIPRAPEVSALAEPPPLAATTPPAPGTNPLSGRTGALLIGIAVALLGERILRIVTNRAASLLGLEGFASPEPTDLNIIDGLAEEDAARLAEERIDSIHALAFTPTSRIFFNTVYGLPRICDWQDQALLIERVGRTNALLLREQFFIRGAIAARRFALQKFGPPEQKSPEKEPEPEQKPEGSGVQTPEKLPAPQKTPDLPQEDVPPPENAKQNLGTGKSTEWLALDKESHLDRALRSLMDDENIEMLEVFWRSVPVLKSR